MWNSRFLAFAPRLAFTPQLRHPYRPRTKGKVERGVEYVEGNFRVGRRFADLADLNRQVEEWLMTVANVRIHATTGERPAERLEQERAVLASLPGRERLLPFVRERRRGGTRRIRLLCWSPVRSAVEVGWAVGRGGGERESGHALVWR